MMHRLQLRRVLLDSPEDVGCEEDAKQQDCMPNSRWTEHADGAGPNGEDSGPHERQHGHELKADDLGKSP